LFLANAGRCSQVARQFALRACATPWKKTSEEKCEQPSVRRSGGVSVENVIPDDRGLNQVQVQVKVRASGICDTDFFRDQGVEGFAHAARARRRGGNHPRSEKERHALQGWATAWR
jgi:hypothetical protein